MRRLIHRTRSTACALLLACFALGALGASAAAAEELPSITQPADQTSVAGKAKTIKIEGQRLAELTATGLPAGVPQPTKVSPTEWKIEGTATEAEVANVTLEAKNGEGTAGPPVTFKWTVAEPEIAPAMTKPPDQTSARGKVKTVVIKGERLAELTATELPAGVPQPTKVSLTEWKIEGTATTVEVASVTLEARNAEGTAGPPVKFKWTVTEPELVPAITNPGAQLGTVGDPVALIVKGAGLASLSATDLPAGLAQPVKVGAGETEWKIEGTLTTHESPTVTLEGRNKEGTETTVSFQWTVSEALPTLDALGDQTSTVGTAITPVLVKGTNLAGLTSKELPAGLKMRKASATEWVIEGTPTTAKAATEVTLEAKNSEEGSPAATRTLKWTVDAADAKKEIETPSKPPETPSKLPETPATVLSAGRLGTVPTQKQGHELFASFLCEVTTCKVTITATVTAGKSKFKVRSKATQIPQGKKVRIPLKLTKKQMTVIAAALKKHKKVTAALSASIDSSVGLQVTKALVVTVKR